MAEAHGIRSPVHLVSGQGPACEGGAVMISAATVYLAAARQARLCALACPDQAELYKARARYWLAMAGAARGAEGRRLP